MKDWNQLRTEIIYRDTNQCQNCFRRSAFLIVHHKIPRRKGGSDDPENLITLCKICHGRLEPKFYIATTNPDLDGYDDRYFSKPLYDLLGRHNY